MLVANALCRQQSTCVTSLTVMLTLARCRHEVHNACLTQLRGALASPRANRSPTAITMQMLLQFY